MPTVSEFNDYGKFLNEKMMLRFSPIAFKMLWEGDELPEGLPRPVDAEGKGKRFAMCQAFGHVRRNRRGMIMLEDDHWCVWPLACLKMRELDEEDYETMGTKLFIKDHDKSVDFFRNKYPWLDTKGKKPIGFAIAPLESCTFEPDIVVIYCRVSQLMAFIKAAKRYTAELWPSQFDSIVSCAYCTVPVLNGQKFCVTLPDPGEYERALADEDEIIFSARAEELPELINAIEELEGIKYSYPDLKMYMELEFPRAQFYDDMFRKWGLKTGEVWKPGTQAI